MASSAAYEPPSVERAWQAFLAHLPTILLIWVACAVISGLGVVVSLGFTAVGIALTSGAAGSDTVSGLADLLGSIVQLPFMVLSSLVGVLFLAVPALHYATGETIGVEQAFRTLVQRPWRYLLAGLLFSVVGALGLILCILPGVAVSLVGPVYVNRIFTTDIPVLQAFTGSFQAVYGSSKGWEFVGIQVLVFLVVLAVAVCTCGLGALVAVPVSTFYLQNAAYHKGVLS
ncbi:hypothetical protein NZK32_01245 [Cyanobium sp. FGCU-52]|nr:hypothetical protein [Cyanobium sp. FGCU52]